MSISFNDARYQAALDRFAEQLAAMVLEDTDDLEEAGGMADDYLADSLTEVKEGINKHLKRELS